MIDVAELLKQNLVINKEGTEAAIKINGKELIETVAHWLDIIQVKELELTTRTYNCIYRYFDREYSVKEIVDLANNGKLSEVKYLGKKGEAEVMRILDRIRVTMSDQEADSQSGSVSV